MNPQRIQRKRSMGWRMPDNTIYVGRPTKWGNPFIPKDGILSLHKCAALYSTLLRGGADALMQDWHPTKDYTLGDVLLAQKLDTLRAAILKNIHELRGKNLACWCHLDQPCHADTLLEIANGE